MKIHLDPTRPIYLQIMEEIKKRTVRGEYKPGEQLPSVREMAKQMEVNPNTIARVYRELEREEFLFTRRGQGSFITEEKKRVVEERKKLADSAAGRFTRQIHELGLNDGYRVDLIESIRKMLRGEDFH